MIRSLILLAIGLLLGLFFLWLGNSPGSVVISFGSYEYKNSPLMATITALIFLSGSLITWKAVKYIWESPSRILSCLHAARHKQGYRAISEGIIALDVRSIDEACQKIKIANKCIAEEKALVGFLNTHLFFLQGNEEAARSQCEEMLLDPEMRLFGLRALYLYNQRRAKYREARNYGVLAEKINPSLDWAFDSLIEAKLEERNWDEALRIIETHTTVHDCVKRNRKCAAILTEKSKELCLTFPEKAASVALQAIAFVSDFTPAFVAAGNAMLKNGDVRKGATLLETSWGINPHPEIADLYVQDYAPDNPSEQLERAKRLQSINPDHVESSLIVAHAAFKSRDFFLAREEVEKALHCESRRGAWLLLALLEEEDKNQAHAKECFLRAAKARRDPAWVAEGYVFKYWYAQSPITGKLDVFEWKAPEMKNAQEME